MCNGCMLKFIPKEMNYSSFWIQSWLYYTHNCTLHIAHCTLLSHLFEDRFLAGEFIGNRKELLGNFRL